MKDIKTIILGSGITIAGNIIIFFLLGLLDLDVTNAFYLKYLADLGTPMNIVLLAGSAIFIALTLSVFAFFKRRMDNRSSVIMALISVTISGACGLFLFKNILLSYLVYTFYAISFIWIAASKDIPVKSGTDKRSLMKEHFGKFSILLTIAMILTGGIFGFIHAEEHEKDVKDSIVETAANLIGSSQIGDIYSINITAEEVASETEFSEYKAGKASDTQMKTIIEKRIKNNSFYSNLNDSDKKNILNQMITAMKNSDTYEEFEKELNDWSAKIQDNLKQQIAGAGNQINTMFPWLDNDWLYAGALALSLLSTFGLVNGLIIRTSMVYLFSFMLQRDATILNPDEPKPIVFSARRPP